MRSFDFYNTLVVRMVANPSDIFSFVGERLAIPDFRSMRIAAEIAARKALGGEVTFEQIYDYVPLALDLKEKARLLELEFEQSLVVPITAVSSQLQAEDMIISDMYHDQNLYRDVLNRLIPGMVPNEILISGSIGVNKASGALWRKVAAEYPTLQSHIGDDLSSDVRQACRHGVKAEHFDRAKLNRYEMALEKSRDDSSIIAGASRATRLSLTRKDSSLAEVATIEAFASVFSPLLLAFSYWIIRACSEEGITDVYFLARDGQLPFSICSRLAREGGQDIRCHYLFASRHALHLPGCKTIDDAESWLLDDTPCLTLRILAERAGIQVEVVVDAAKPYMVHTPDTNIPQAERRLLSKVIREPPFVAAFRDRVSQAFESASAYYLTQGFAKNQKVAVVDVGWNGRLQRSLGNLLEKSGHRPKRILGLYFCLSRRTHVHPGDELRGFVAAPECPEQVVFFDQYRHVFEAALSADHPTVEGFDLAMGSVRPLFGIPYPPGTQEKIVLQHATVNTFIENIITLGHAAGRPILPSVTPIIENFRRFLSEPTENDGRAFWGFSFVEGQTGAESKPISKTLKVIDLLRRDYGYWPEGSLSASGFKAAVFVRGLAKRMRRKVVACYAANRAIR